MIATTATTRAGRTKRSRFTVPDAAIRIYFAMFPALVVLFLTVQAVRAQIPDIDVAPASAQAVAATSTR